MTGHTDDMETVFPSMLADFAAEHCEYTLADTGGFTAARVICACGADCGPADYDIDQDGGEIADGEAAWLAHIDAELDQR